MRVSFQGEHGLHVHRSPALACPCRHHDPLRAHEHAHCHPSHARFLSKTDPGLTLSFPPSRSARLSRLPSHQSPRDLGPPSTRRLTLSVLHRVTLTSSPGDRAILIHTVLRSLLPIAVLPSLPLLGIRLLQGPIRGLPFALPVSSRAGVHTAARSLQPRECVCVPV